MLLPTASLHDQASVQEFVDVNHAVTPTARYTNVAGGRNLQFP